MEDSDRPVQTTISAGELLQDAGLPIPLSLVAGGGGLSRRITHTRIQKSGLALAGHYHGVVPSRIQILGETELSYFNSLDAEQQSRAASGFFGLELSCVIVTRGSKPPAELVRWANDTGTPLLVSVERSSRTIT